MFFARETTTLSRMGKITKSPARKELQAKPLVTASFMLETPIHFVLFLLETLRCLQSWAEHSQQTGSRSV